jgi:hypothetical protein
MKRMIGMARTRWFQQPNNRRHDDDRSQFGTAAASEERYDGYTAVFTILPRPLRHGPWACVPDCGITVMGRISKSGKGGERPSAERREPAGSRTKRLRRQDARSAEITEITVTRPSLSLLIRGGGLASRLAAALARRERAPETLLDLRHKARRTERPADQLAPSQADRGGGGGFPLDEVGEMRRAVF